LFICSDGYHYGPTNGVTVQGGPDRNAIMALMSMYCGCGGRNPVLCDKK
jgi:hypothetical protein